MTSSNVIDQDMFREAEAAALQYLTRPDTLPKAQSLKGWFPQLYLWHFPSFDAHQSWAIYQRRERGSRVSRSLLRQTTWDYLADSKRFLEPLTGLEKGLHPQPTIEVRDRPLDTATFEERLSLLQKISFPPFESRGIGIDGESFGIRFPRPGAQVEWWCAGPDSWQTLTQWAKDTRSWLIAIAAAPPEKEPKFSVRPRCHDQNEA